MTDYPKELFIERPLIFDSHAHYDDKKFDGIRYDLLDSLNKNGVDKIVTCGCDKVSSLTALSLSDRYPYIYAAVGIHPENLDSASTIADIEELASHKKCVAIGEIGLDYYWNKENREKQIEIFEQQIILAKKLNLPVIVHDREAHSDTLEILKRQRPQGVVHCFSGSVEMAEEILGLGMYLGVGGVITFKNARKLPDVVKIIPDDRLLIETDCPYLAPEPHRGELCHSGMIKLTAQKIAEIRFKTPCEILKITNENARRLFKIK